MPRERGHPVITGVYWITRFLLRGMTGLPHAGPPSRPNRPYFVSANAVGVLPVTWRKACENAGTLA
jgi:hypothetical protein